MNNEGYIKFLCDWTKNAIELPAALLDEINAYRNKLRKKQMIGKIPNGPGFGNISVRFRHGFVITGSNTGHIKKLSKSDLAYVQNIDVAKNEVSCQGETIASSESMSHGIIYKLPRANAVIHIHDKKMWETLLHKIPTTKPEISYGTPEMANEILRLVKQAASNVFVLGGHQDGLIAYGKSLHEAYNQIIDLGVY